MSNPEKETLEKLQKIFEAKVPDTGRYANKENGNLAGQRYGLTSVIILEPVTQEFNSPAQIEIFEQQIPSIIRLLAGFYRGNIVEAIIEEFKD